MVRYAVKTRDVAAELADELDIGMGAWNGADVLGLPDGRVVDLGTGEIRAAERAERVYQRLAVVPEPGEPSEWLRVLGETFAALAQPERGDCLRPMVVPVLARGVMR